MASRKLMVFEDTDGLPSDQESGKPKNEAKVKRGDQDEFRWQLKYGNQLQVNFKSGWPFAYPKETIHGTLNVPTAKRTMRSDASGSYPYDLTVDGVTRDPRIIIVENIDIDKLLILGTLALGAGVALATVGVKLLKRHHRQRRLTPAEDASEAPEDYR